MKPFDPKRMANLGKRIDASGSNSPVFTPRDLGDGESQSFKLILPHKNQGNPDDYPFMVETLTYWIGGKPYMTRVHEGKENIIAMRINEARAKGDRSINALLDDTDKLRPSTEFYFPVRLVKVDYTDNTCVISDPRKTIMAVTPSVAKKIYKFVTMERVFAVSPNTGIFSPKLGYTLEISREGTGKNNTKYEVILGVQSALPKDQCTAPDILAYLRKESKSQQYLDYAICAYIYGTELPARDEWDDEDDDELAGAIAMQEDEEEETPPPVKDKKPTKPAPVQTNTEDDEDEDTVNEDDEEETPPPVKDKTPAKAPVKTPTKTPPVAEKKTPVKAPELPPLPNKKPGKPANPISAINSLNDDLEDE